MACTATCGSSAQAWTHRSPPLRAGSRLSPGNCGRSTSASGRRPGQVRTSSKRDGPKPIVSVSRDGLRPSASPVSSGGASASPPYAPSPTACPAVIRAAAAVQSFSSCTNVGAVVGRHVERGEVQPVLDGGGDPGLVRAVEGDRGAGCRRPAPASSPVRAIATAPPAAAAPSASPAPPQPSSARRDGDGQLSVRRRSVVAGVLVMVPTCPAATSTTAAASLDSGSASAFTPSESSLRSALPTLSYEANPSERLVRAVLVQQRVQRGELLVELGGQRRVVLCATGLSSSYAFSRALDVGLEVDQVGVRVALLLAGDLAGGDLVEELLGAVGHRGRGDVGLADPLLPVLEVLVELGASVLLARRRSSCPATAPSPGGASRSTSGPGPPGRPRGRRPSGRCHRRTRRPARCAPSRCGRAAYAFLRGVEVAACARRR